jgi:hypothetical protein
MRLEWKVDLVCLVTVLTLTQDGCMVCVERTQKSFWTHPMEVLGDVGHVESYFGPFGDSVNVSAR